MSNHPFGTDNYRASKILPLIVYLGIWTCCLVLFWGFTDGSDAMGYSILCFWIVLPLAILIVSYLIGKRNDWGNKKWLLLIFFGIMYMLAEYGTFGCANMLTFKKFHIPEFKMILIGGGISLIGMGIGAWRIIDEND